MQSQLSRSPQVGATKSNELKILGDKNSQTPVNGSIRAIKRPHSSKIPSPPSSELLSTPTAAKRSPIDLNGSRTPKDATPTSCSRKEALKHMEEKLDSKLSCERRIQAKIMTQLDAMEDMSSEEAIALKKDADTRADRVFSLSQKLTRTRHTLLSLESAQAEYHSTARKVEAAEEKLAKAAKENVHQGRRSTTRVSAPCAASIRKELDQATSMMSAAFKRVEQIESITDGLIEQLVETEMELNEMQALRQHETQAHAEELVRLQCLLDDAQIKATQGTPVGNGAKIVLPMALERIRDTQQALREQEAAVIAARNEMEKLTKETATREAALCAKIKEIDNERYRQLAEKQASLESMTRAAAAATKEAAIKQENVMKLTTEITTLNQQRQELEHQLNDSFHRNFELQSQLKDLESTLDDVTSQKDARSSEAEALRCEMHKASAQRQQLEESLKEATEKSLKLETCIEEMTSALLRAKESAENAAAERDAAELQVTEMKNRLEEVSRAHARAQNMYNEAQKKLLTTEKCVRDMKDQVEISQKEVISLLDENQHDRELALQSERRLTWQIEALGKELQNKEREKNDAAKVAEEEGKRARELEKSLEALKETYVKAQNNHLARSGELAAILEEKESRIAAAESQLMAAITTQEEMMSSQNRLRQQLEEKQRGIEEMRQVLTSRDNAINSLEEKISSLRDSEKKTSESLHAMLETADKERCQLRSECRHLEKTIKELSDSLQTTTQDLQQAKSDRSNSEKELTLSLVKIRGIEATMVDMKKTLEMKERALAERDEEIQQAREELRRSSKESAASKVLLDKNLQSTRFECKRLKERIEDKEKLVMKLQGDNTSLKSEIEVLHQELTSASARESSLRTMLEDSSASFDAKITVIKEEHEKRLNVESEKLNEAVARLHTAVKDRDNVVADKVEMAKRVMDLTAALSNMQRDMEHRSNLNKEVMKRSFDKIRLLQAEIAGQEKHLLDMEARLECAEDNGSQLVVEIEKKAAEIEELRTEKIDLESTVCRLRMDLLDEVSKVDEANKTIQELTAALHHANTAADDIAGIRAISEAKSEAIKTLQARIAELEGSLLDQKKDSYDTIVDLNNQIQELERDRSHHAEALATALAQRDRALFDSVAFAREVDSWKQQVEEKKKTIQELSSLVEVQGKNLNDVQTEASGREVELLQEIEALKRRLANLREEYCAASGVVDSQNDKIRRMENDMRREAARTEMLERAGIEMRAIIEEMRSSKLSSSSLSSSASSASVLVAKNEEAQGAGKGSNAKREREHGHRSVGVLMAAAVIGAVIHTAHKL